MSIAREIVHSVVKFRIITYCNGSLKMFSLFFPGEASAVIPLWRQLGYLSTKVALKLTGMLM
jgi:hypothetical protein